MRNNLIIDVKFHYCEVVTRKSLTGIHSGKSQTVPDNLFFFVQEIQRLIESLDGAFAEPIRTELFTKDLVHWEVPTEELNV